MLKVRDDLEILIWKDNERKTAAEHFDKLTTFSAQPNERSGSLTALIVCIANVNDVALTKFYASELAKHKILSQKQFMQRVEEVTLEAPTAPKKETTSLNPNHIASEIQAAKKIIYLTEKFYIFSGGVFKIMSNVELSSLVKAQTNQHFSTYLLREVTAALMADTFKRPEEINKHVTLLNVKNGMLDLETWELKPHDSKYLSTQQISCDYDLAAKCSKWLAFLEQMFGDDPIKIDILQEFFGYCLTPKTNQEKVILMVGEGANGKSKVLDVLQGLIGISNASAVPLEQFKNPHYLAEFFGSMINISYESNTKTQVYEATFKQLISGETISADRKYGHPFTFKNTCKLIFAFNTMPYIDDTTDAVYRRIIPIPCNVQIPEDEQNKNLSQELLEELPGILNWALHGLRRLREQDKFSNSPSVKELLQEYRKDNNNVISFADECCLVDPIVSSTKKDLYEAYEGFCKTNGYSPLAIRKFIRRLKKYCRTIIDDSGTDNVKLLKGIQPK